MTEGQPASRRYSWRVRFRAWRWKLDAWLAAEPGVRKCGCCLRPDGTTWLLWCKPHREASYAKRDPMRPAIDRALDGDHRLCGLDPCSDCR